MGPFFTNAEKRADCLQEALCRAYLEVFLSEKWKISVDERVTNMVEMKAVGRVNIGPSEKCPVGLGSLGLFMGP
jgi:hypothetical protein